MIFINCTVNKSTGLFRPFFPVSLPFGIAYLMAILKKEGLAFDYVDSQIHKDIINESEKRLRAIGCSPVFCFSFLTEAVDRALECARTLKERHPSSIIIFGGIHTTALPELMLSYPFVDYIFCGEAESSIADICRKLNTGDDISDCPGIGSKSNNKLIINPRPPVVDNLDSLPQIPYEIFSVHKKYDLGYFSISRGCPYQCIYCCNNVTGSLKCRFKSPEKVIEEMSLLIDNYGCRDLYFFDDNFLTNETRIKALCDGIRKAGLNKKARFSFQSRARDVQPEIMQELFNSGFKTIFFGIESVSDRLLNNIGKNESVSEIKRAVMLAKQIGFKVIANFMFCLPEESKQDRILCVDFCIEQNIDVVKFNNIVPYPGTKLYDTCRNNDQFINSVRFSHFNSQLVLVTPFWKKVHFPFLPQGTSGSEIIYDTLIAYLKFYFRGRIILRMLKKNWGGLVFRYGNSAAEVFVKLPMMLLLSFDILMKISILPFRKIKTGGK